MKPKPGCADALVEVFQRNQIIERALTVEGCHDVSVLTSEESVLVTATWTDAAAYQAWVDHPGRNVAYDELNALLSSELTDDTVGGLYEVALSGTSIEPEET
ncbi:MAG: antibiotic biosynthesis monooxygenase family protein [Actinomycetota bacterium]